MASDIKLDEDMITLEGFTTKAQSADFWLDHFARRPGTDPSSPRRALVHDISDGLTINFNGDYPGGVSVHGSVSIPGKLSLNGKLLLKIDELEERGEGDDVPVAERPGGFDPKVLPPAVPDHLAVDPFEHLKSHRSPIDLAREIVILRRLILSLHERVKDLESK